MNQLSLAAGSTALPSAAKQKVLQHGCRWLRVGGWNYRRGLM